MKMGEEITSTKRVYDGYLVKLDLHDVRLPDGNASKREVIKHPGAVALVAVDDNNKILMVRQFRIAAGKVMLEIPAGTLEPGEPPSECAARELQEETGYKPTQLESLGGIYAAPGYTTEFIHLFYASGLVESSLDQDSDEFIEMERISLTDALHMIDSGEIDDSKTVNGILRVARKLGIS